MGRKHEIRDAFRNAVFKRAGYKCQGPGCTFRSTKDKAVEELDAHHVTDRHHLPNGGYVPENGIALCAPCHLKAEHFHSTGTALPGWSPEDLYGVIGSNYELAWIASEKL